MSTTLTHGRILLLAECQGTLDDSMHCPQLIVWINTHPTLSQSNHKCIATTHLFKTLDTFRMVVPCLSDPDCFGTIQSLTRQVQRIDEGFISVKSIVSKFQRW